MNLRHCLRVKQMFSINKTYKTALQKYYQKNEPILGYCTQQKSEKYATRNKKVHSDNWRKPLGIKQQLKISSVGIGTFNGQPSPEVDYQMFRAIADTIKSGGVNMIDTCSLYRFGKSQKVINAVLNYLIREQGYNRQQFLISTKCGYIPNDIDSNLEEKDFIKILLNQRIVQDSDIVQRIHCVHPNFIDFSVQKSRLALGLETIDVLYLNNFSEAQMPIIGEQKFYQRLKIAFNKMEQMRSQNRIRYYGICSYVGLRSPETEQKVHLNFQKTIQIAKSVGGDNHGYRFVMLPLSLGTPEAMLKWQGYTVGDKKQYLRSFDIAERENINIVSCSPLFQGRIANLPFQSNKIGYLQHNSAKHIQMMRSYYSPALLTTLVGQVQEEHIKKNLTVLEAPCLNEKEWKQILQLPQ